MIRQHVAARLVVALAAGGTLAVIGAFAHRREWLFTAGSSKQMHCVYGIILTVTVLAAWTRIIREFWAMTDAAAFLTSWLTGTLLISSSRDDVLIAADALGYAYLICGAVCGVLALAWPTREARIVLRQLRKGRNV